MKTAIVLTICCLAMVACTEEKKETVTADSTKNMMDNTSKEVMKKTDDVMDKSKEMAKEVGTAVDEKTDDVMNKANGMAKKVTDAVEEKSDTVSLPRLVYYTISDA
ncbi:MAG: seryl-tRNA synthetase [Planctomycetota bacterium]|jgi:seryl-tRNA synthetase